MSDKIKRLFKKYSYPGICFIITISLVLLSILKFPDNFVRIKECFVDLWQSIKYYISELFYLDWNIDVTVINKSVVPFVNIFNLPESWEEFQLMWNKYWNLFYDTDNLQGYLYILSDIMYYFTRFMLLIGFPLIVVLYLTIQRYLTTENNDYDKTSIHLKRYKLFEQKVIYPIRDFILGFIDHVRENINFYYLWLLLIAYCFNMISISIEFFAYYMYFVFSFDFGSIFIQIYKLMSDLSPMIAFVPVWCWCIVGYVVLCITRENIAYGRLNHMERKNRGFINERPIVLMLCGTMGSKKTTVITDMGLSVEIMYRDKALDLMLKNHLRFPEFPFINLERFINKCIDRHEIYNLATCTKTIGRVKNLFIEGLKDKALNNSIKRHFKKVYGLKFNNLLFNYDYENYRLSYNDKLSLLSIWEMIENYTKLYFVYVVKSSVIYSNYAIRSACVFNDKGNFPLWTDNLWSESENKNYSHILDFDIMRLGKKVENCNYQKEIFEFGVVNITEAGKERGNSLELKEVKKDDLFANQKNDGFNSDLKMCRHPGTIEYFPFVKILTDEQRPASWGADARELCDIVHIRKTSEIKLVMPFFAVMELVNDFLMSHFKEIYLEYRFNRADNTLFMYLIKKFTSWIYTFYTRKYNMFGVSEINVQVENGAQEGYFEDKKYYLSSKKIYSKRFSTDCFSGFFTEINSKAIKGINETPVYETDKASFEELNKQNSYFINDLKNRR